MNQRLTKKDTKELMYQLRPRFAVPILFALILSPVVFYFFYTYDLDYSSGELAIVFLLILSFAILIGLFLSRKYLLDIQCGEKKVEVKKIQKKVSNVDYEAGSGTLYIGQEMKRFIALYLIIENIKYRVEQELFENCKEGDEVLFFYGLKSNLRIGIELKNKSRSRF